MRFQKMSNNRGSALMISTLVLLVLLSIISGLEIWSIMNNKKVVQLTTQYSQYNDSLSAIEKAKFEVLIMGNYGGNIWSSAVNNETFKVMMDDERTSTIYVSHIGY